MNEIRPYEQLMAAKLDQVPVPDMSDSIWASIEMELDGPAASRGNPAPSPDSGTEKPRSAFDGWGWFSLAGVMLVVALLWWYFGHKAPVPTPPRTLPEKHAPVLVEPPPAKEHHRSEKPAKKKDIPVLPVEIKKDTAAYHAAVPIDSVHADSVVKKMLPDVDLYAAPPAPAPAPASGGKKHKGVKGITDDDYKISAGKDSGKKKN